MQPDPFIIDDSDRYSRLQLIGWWEQKRLAQARVLVVGAGALGNEVLKNLALLGVGHIDIVDFDRVENSNLSRSVLFRGDDQGQPKATVAAAAMRQLNANVNVNSITGNVMTSIGLGLVRGADIVIGCLDNREARLWVNRMCWKVNTPWIDGGIQEINGVVKVFLPPDGPCYECGMTENDYRLINLRYSCPLLKHEDLMQGKVPTAPTIASIIAGLQVQEMLKLLHEFPASESTAWVYNGVANQMYGTRFPIRPDCLSHETYDPIRSVPWTCRSTAAHLLDWAARETGAAAELVLDRDWVTTLHCATCDRQRDVFRPQMLTAFADAICDRCQEVMRPSMIHRIDGQSPHASRTLQDLGVPDFDIVRIEAGGRAYYYQLHALASEPTHPEA